MERPGGAAAGWVPVPLPASPLTDDAAASPWSTPGFGPQPHAGGVGSGGGGGGGVGLGGEPSMLESMVAGADPKQLDALLRAMYVHGHRLSGAQARMLTAGVVLLGVSVLFPWNAFVTAIDYFRSLYRPSLSGQLEFLLAMCYCVPNTLGLLLQTFVLRHYLSPATSIVGAFVVYVATVVLLPLLGDLALSQDSAFALTLAVIAIAGVANASMQGPLFGEVARLSPLLTQALMMGNGLSGVVVGSLRLGTKLAMDSSPAGLREATLLYFMVGAAVIVAALAAYLSMCAAAARAAH